MFTILGDPLQLAIQNINESPKVYDPCNAVLYFRGPTTYIHGSYHETITRENDANPLT